MYAIKNLQDLKGKPSSLTETVFTRFFEIAKIANFSDKEKAAYQSSLMNLMKMWNRCATFEASYAEGLKLGKEEGLKQGLEECSKQAQVKIAIKMRNIGMSSEDIFNLTGLEEGQY